MTSETKRFVPDMWIFAAYFLMSAMTLVGFCLLFFHLAPGYAHLHFYQDFNVFYDVAQRLHAGEGPAIYRESLSDLQAFLRGEHAHFLSNPFVNPPPFLLLIYPLGGLSRETALTCWIMLGLAVWSCVFRLPDVKKHFPRLFSAPRFGLCYSFFVLCSAYAYPAVELGQVDLFTAVLMVLLLVYRTTRPWLSGFLLGLLCIKPHLALAFPLLFIVERNFKAFAAAVFTLAALVCITCFCFGAQIWQDYFREMSLYQHVMATDAFDTARSTVSFYQAFRLFFTMPAAIALHAVITLTLAVIVAFRTRHMQDDGNRMALWLILTLLLSPYVLSYNLAALLLVGLVMADRCLLRPRFEMVATAVVFAGVPGWMAMGLSAPYIPLVLLAGILHLLYADASPEQNHDRPARGTS